MFVNSDFSELLRLFNAGKVRYLIVGGYAVIQYTALPVFFTGPTCAGYRSVQIAVPATSA